VINVCDCVECRPGKRPYLTMAGATGTGGSRSLHPDHELILDNVRDGHIKIKNLKASELKELCTTFYDYIEDLEVRLEKSKHPPPPQYLRGGLRAPGRAELKDLKDPSLVNENGLGDKPTGSLT
jgi:hypothetical protein